ncbi:MAG: prepilin-type N-terminal cleavage/methylation domain-containing protein, partial [Pseudomonadota bacterium]
MDARAAEHELSTVELARAANKPVSERGFTFFEVMVALALLAVAASILIGMEGAAIRRTLRDTNAQQAMLAARRIMAAVETMKEPDFNLSNQNNRPVLDVLQELGAPNPTDPTALEALQNISASITVEDWILPIPNAESSPMKRVAVSLSRGPQPADRFDVR